MWWWVLPLALAGEVVGTVVGPDGQPIEDALVLAYDVRFKYELDRSGRAGGFRITGLKDGERRIRVIPPDGVNAVEHYLDNGMPICEAEIIDVARDQTIELGTIQVPEGGVVRGRVLAPNGAPLSGAQISSRPFGVSPTSLPRKGVSDQDGYFSIHGIPVENDGSQWAFQVDDPRLPLQYLGDAYAIDFARSWEVAIGLEVDIGEWQVLPGGILAGEVTGPDGPLTEGTVFATTTGRTKGSNIQDGRFRISGLAPGEASLWVEAPGYAVTWYPSDPRPGNTIGVNDGQRIDGLTLEADPESVLRGQLTGFEDFTGVRVFLVDEDRAVSLDTEAAADGSFELRQVPSGRWSVELDPADGMDIIDGPLVDAEGNLWILEIERGEDRDLGALLVPRGAVVEGRIVDRESGEPVYGAWVYAVNANTDTSASAQSGRAGKYRVEGLPAGVYRLHVEYAPYCESDPSWVNRYYPDQRNELLTGSIPLAPGQVATWDPQVPPDMDHDQMDDAWELRFGLDPDVDDAFEDLDGDGFPNLDEYLLGTNPAGDEPELGGCGGGAAWLLWLVPVVGLRRKSATACQLPV